MQKESVKNLVKIGKSERKIRKEFKEKQKQCIKYSQIKIKQWLNFKRDKLDSN